MDATISIGGRSLLDGVLRILGPALEPLQAPIPIALPGVTDALLRIKSIRGVQQNIPQTFIELDLEVDLSGEVLFIGNLESNVLSFNGAITLNATPDAATIRDPKRISPIVGGAATGTVGPAGLNITSLTGSVEIPQTNVPVDLKQILGTIQVPPAGVQIPGIPFPGVVPVPVHFTAGGPLKTRVRLLPGLPGQPFGNPAAIPASGLELEFGLTSVAQIPQVDLQALAATLQASLTTALTSIANQLATSLPAVVPQPNHDALAVSNALSGVIGTVVQSLLTSLFSGLRARVGPLTFPVPAAGSSCEVRALPTVAQARITADASGGLILQIGVDRTTTAGAGLPAFFPSAGVDTGVTIENTFLRDLLACMLERVPHLSLPPGGPALTNPGGNPTATWAPITVALGPLALTGTLTLAITGAPAGPANVPVPKAITLTFALGQNISAPLVPGPAFVVSITVAIPIAFDLSTLATLTSLRDLGVPTPNPFLFEIGPGLTAMLIGFGVLIGLPVFIGPVAAVWFGLPVLGFMVASFPHVVVAIIRGFVLNTINQLLSGLRLLESPAALPPAIFDAFGPLVPTTMIVDDLVAGGIMQTPTSPWMLRPMLGTGRRILQPPDRGPGGGHTLPPDFDIPVTTTGGFTARS